MILAILLALLAAVVFGVSAIFARLGLQGMRFTTGTVVSLVAGVVVVGLATFAVHGGDMFSFPPRALVWFTLLGFINYVLGRLLNFASIHLAGVGRATPILATTPLVAVGLGVALGGETLTPLVALGTLAIVGGLVLILSERAA